MAGGIAKIRVARQTEAEKRAQGERILDARNRGDQMHTIAAREGIAERTAYRRMDDAVNARVFPTVDEYRRQQDIALDLELRRSDETLAAANAMLSSDEVSTDTILKALELRQKVSATRIRVMERRAKLMGLDAPIKAEVQATVTVEAESLDVMELIRQAQARNAEREAEMHNG